MYKAEMHAEGTDPITGAPSGANYDVRTPVLNLGEGGSNSIQREADELKQTTPAYHSRAGGRDPITGESMEDAGLVPGPALTGKPTLPLVLERRKEPRKHSHYFKDVRHLDEVDVYRILELYNVTDQAIGHAIKKLLVAGGRGAKDQDRDVKEAIDTLVRRQDMRIEDQAKSATE